MLPCAPLQPPIPLPAGVWAQAMRTVSPAVCPAGCADSGFSDRFGHVVGSRCLWERCIWGIRVYSCRQRACVTVCWQK